MRVLLISANREDMNMVTLPLGLAFVAASTQRHGHEVELVDLMRADDARERVASAVRRFDPEAIGISIRNIDDQNMSAPRFLLEQVKEVMEACRENSQAPIILGGAGYSIFPKAVLDYLGADAGIQGEGEWVFPELLGRLAARETLDGLPGAYLPGAEGTAGSRFVTKLDRLPWPEVARWLTTTSPDRDLSLPFQTRRGCPIGCSYCSTPTIEGRLLRKCSPRTAVDAVESYLEAGFNRLFFTDNTFNLPPSFAKAFCRAVIDRGLKPVWRCIIYPGRMDPELAGLLAQAGCTGASLGFESGSDFMLRRLNKRFGVEAVTRARRMLGEAGIQVMGFLLLGAPGETRETVMESLDFIDRLKPEVLRLTVGVRIYPYTPLARHAYENNLIEPDDDLLHPRFYMEPGLEEWLPETAGAWAASRPNCLT